MDSQSLEGQETLGEVAGGSGFGGPRGGLRCPRLHTGGELTLAREGTDLCSTCFHSVSAVH